MKKKESTVGTFYATSFNLLLHERTVAKIPYCRIKFSTFAVNIWFTCVQLKPMLRAFKTFFIVSLLLLGCTSPYSRAQSVPQLAFKPTEYNAALRTTYSEPKTEGDQDSIFIITAPTTGTPTTITLSGTAENAPGATLEIQKIILSSTDYTYSWENIKKESNVKKITVNIAPSAPTAYRLLRIKDTDTLQKRIWVTIDDVQLLDLYIDDRCNARTLTPRFNYDRSTIIEERFTYSDLTSQYLLPINTIGRIYFKNFQWLDDRHAPLTDFSTSTLVLMDPSPLEPQGYRLVVTNFYGRTLVADAPIRDPIAVKPILNASYIDKPDAPTPTWQAAGKSLTHEAPLHLKLADDSKNADSVIWTIRNDPRAVRSGAPDTLFLANTLASERATHEIDHKLFTAGIYIATLRTVNNREGCVDTANFILNVDSSLINMREIPNVFTPNGDFINDVFRFKNPESSVRSIRNFSIEIFNRGGQSIYSYNGNPRTWEGWNGKRKNTGSDEPQGVYFFVIRADGWDGKTFRGETYRSFVHLYR